MDHRFGATNIEHNSDFYWFEEAWNIMDHVVGHHEDGSARKKHRGPAKRRKAKRLAVQNR